MQKRIRKTGATKAQEAGVIETKNISKSHKIDSDILRQTGGNGTWK